MPRPTSPIVVGLATVVLGGALYVGTRSVAGAPPLGPLLDPVHGVWALARTAVPAADAEAAVRGLGSSVDVRFDSRGVPHVFATSLADAARAIGYIHARDRLFQMEVQTRAVAGTLAELVGDRAVPLDREARAQGLAVAARKSYDTLPPSDPSRRLADAYAEGVNAWIDAMSRDELPFEFRLLGAHPQRWEPAYTAYLFARMGLTLAMSDGELRRGTAEALVGRAAVDAVFPRDQPIQEPIQPTAQRAPRVAFRPLPPPQPTDSAALRVALALDDAFARVATLDVSGTNMRDRQLDDVAVGSNNWAVSPRRSASGHALLAGDPHLSLTLPSIWYQAHIVVPDSLDVYGVTIPGAPIPPIGFNRDLAWSETNTGADVADYFIETVNDSLHPTQYRLDGAWQPLRQRIEAIRGKGGRVVETDTVYETHRGPMLRTAGRWVSRRWTVTDVSDAMRVFLDLARARTVKDGWAATDGFHAPAQNFVMADRGGHIALRSTGHYPVRAKTAARGDLLIDGSTRANDWQGWWKPSEYPQAYDPAQGYVASANQQPKDPTADPRYFGWDWPSPWRAMRINEVLRADSAMTVDAMRRLQTDPVSAQTKYFLPAILAAAREGAARDTSLRRAADLLGAWDGRMLGEQTAIVLYDAILSELTTRTWDELQAPRNGSAPREGARRVSTPQASVLAELLAEPESPWWDDRSTPNVRERRDDIMRASITAAWGRVTTRLGPPGPAWEWGRSRHALVRHLIGIPALSRPDVPVQAGPGTVSPSSGDGNHGASWRMVVELGPEVRAWGVYPGGQSGNPISPRYADLIGKWSAGTLDSLPFPRKPDELPPSAGGARLVLRGAK
jgi:penicillin amidase